MPFPTFEFFAFFTVVLILNWSLKRWPLAWRLFLLLASYFFYSVWDTRFLIIIFVISLFNFLTGQAICRNFLNRRLILALAVGMNILALGYFKYYDFFRVSAESLLLSVKIPATFPLLEIILPIGLSFYIFRVISYNIDVFRGKYPATRSLLDFSIYVAFFPQLLSGPIARVNDFLPQLIHGGARKIENAYESFTLIFLGLFKKLVLSSYLAANITDDVFAVPENHTSLVILLAVFAYSLVIYFDFSGYSDLAIGFAGLMGFKSPTNFDRPYLSLNIQDFWRRWHITLSGWIRDYVYIPLGGNQKGVIRKYFNLMVIMLIIGLWHGAAGHFVVWGGINGVALVVNHISRDRKKNNPAPRTEKKLLKIFWWFITFSFVSFSWIFFRSDGMAGAFNLIKNLLICPKNYEQIKLLTLVVLVAGFFVFLFEKQISKALTVFQQKISLTLWLAFVLAVVLLLFKLSPDILPPFIYFSF